MSVLELNTTPHVCRYVKGFKFGGVKSVKCQDCDIWLVTKEHNRKVIGAKHEDHSECMLMINEYIRKEIDENTNTTTD